MHPNNAIRPVAGTRPFKYLYFITMLFLALSGFGQMPIFKRYYIADIPGFGWLAQFFVTHYIHYIGAAIILGLFAYAAVEYILLKPGRMRITVSGHVRVLLLAATAATGIFMVIRNFPGYRFSPGFIIFLDFAHLGMAVVFLMVALFCVLMKKKWTIVVIGGQ